MKTKLQYGFLTTLICLLASPAWADTLELKNGSLIKGVYVVGSESQINFRVGSTVQQYDVADVVALKFESSETSRSNNDHGFATRDDRDSRRNHDSQRDDSQRGDSQRDQVASAPQRRQSYSSPN